MEIEQNKGNGKHSNIKTAFFLNVVFAIFELIGGILTNSVFLLSDAIHDLGDSFSLGTAWILERLSIKKPDRTFTYGYGRFSVLGALLTGLVLVFGTVFILIESSQRLFAPEEINTPVVLVFAVFGLFVNGYAAYKTSKSSSINERIVSLHMLEDMIGWVVLLLAAIMMMIVNVPILDPLLSILFSLFILLQAFKHLKQAAVVFLEGTTGHVSDEMIKERLMAIDGISDVHHIHQWTTDGNISLATMHVLLACVLNQNQHHVLLHQIKHELLDLGIQHTTIETEYLPCESEDCVTQTSVTHHHHHH